MILAGDVGGTKVHLALCTFEEGKLRIVRDRKFAANEFATLKDVVDRFLDDPEAGRMSEKVIAACFGCPGPVREGRIQLTNLPWLLDTRELSQELDIEHLFLINDLEANGYGIGELDADSIFTLHEGDRTAAGHRALIAAGTGLGQAQLIWNPMTRRFLPLASEGGHADFAARTPLEIELLQYLLRELKGRISWERVISGLGLQNIYKFLRDEKKLEEPQWLRERMEKEDPNAVIGICGEDGSSELCAETLNLFAAAYGAQAGNMALSLLAAGGVYLGGGIAPKLLKTLQNGRFRDAFVDKGRLSPLLHTIPVRVILEQRCALMGAAAYAEMRAAEITGHSERVGSKSAG
ncbi:MAG: glucokinase [Acidobacteria bacterium]|nr:glucokinase [Acidobacteriota bacterium]